MFAWSQLFFWHVIATRAPYFLWNKCGTQKPNWSTDDFLKIPYFCIEYVRVTFNFPKFNRLTLDEVDYFDFCVTQVSFISPILSDLHRRKVIFVHDGRRMAFCMRRIPKKEKKNLKDRNETKRCDWNVRQDERCCKTKRSLGNGQGKKNNRLLFFSASAIGGSDSQNCTRE